MAQPREPLPLGNCSLIALPTLVSIEGDTVTDANNPCTEALPGYKKARPMVYCGLYPADGAKYPDLRDALEVRMALEELSVVLACERIDDEGKKKLLTAGVEFKEAINSKLVPAIVEKDERFHDVIFEASQNQRLITMAMNLREKVYRYRFEYVKVFSYHDKLITEHDEITKAIFRGDKEAAQKIMRKHIYDQEQIVIENTIRENGN